MATVLRFLIFASCFAVGRGTVFAEESIEVKVIGVLRTGIVAIGGESTGTIISAKGVTWELDLGRNAERRRAVEALNGKAVEVRGTLERRKGIEVKERWIVTVTAIRAAAEPAAGKDDEPGVKARPRRADSRIRVDAAGGGVVLDIESEFGIDSATITRVAEVWPEPILVKLRLKGLESFRVTAQDRAVEWSVSSVGEHPSRVSLVEGGKETSIGDNSPYFTAVEMVGGGGKIPLKGGHFALAVPPKLLDPNPEEVTMRWIDFYR